MAGTTRKSLTVLLAITALFLTAGGGFVTYSAGTRLIERSTRKVGPPPADLPVEAVSFESAGSRLAGWFIDRKESCGLAVLMHGLRANRSSMLARARLLHRASYAVLLFDFQAHGESEGDAITFGFRESKNAESAIAFARARRPDLPLAVIGSSLGGAAAVLANKPTAVAAYVLEAVYPTLEQAAHNRMRLQAGAWAPLITQALLAQLPLRLGFWAGQLEPKAMMSGLAAPVLVIAGDRDRRTTLADSRAIFDQALAPKKLWVVKGAAHVDFQKYDSVGYAREVLPFLGRHVGCPGN